jgi:DNA-binding NarL/FixJ family response regulator
MLTAAHVFKVKDVLTNDFYLTPRQVAVLAAVVEGETFKAAADRCGIAVKTARVHLHHVYHKLGTRTKLGAYKKVLEIYQATP